MADGRMVGRLLVDSLGPAGGTRGRGPCMSAPVRMDNDYPWFLPLGVWFPAAVIRLASGMSGLLVGLRMRGWLRNAAAGALTRSLSCRPPGGVPVRMVPAPGRSLGVPQVIVGVLSRRG
jgi:hypothetical protein